MPARGPCRQPGCLEPATGLDGRCDAHSKRPAASRTQKRTRQDVLNRDSLCRLCGFRLATEVEQIASDADFELTNLRGVCRRCHQRGRQGRRTGQTVTEQLGAVGTESPSGRGALVVTRGPTAGGKRFMLDRDVTVAGRQPGTGILLEDGTVSRRHAEFSRRASGEVTVRDLGSLNGTHVNGERVDDTTLAPGDEVRIGAYRLVFYASL